MRLKKEEWAIFFVNLIYIAAFALYYLSIKNYEFLWYIGVMGFFICLILFTLNYTKFDYWILIGLSFWGFLHMAGGGIVVNGDVLYAFEIFKIFEIGDTYVLKFDQFVHAFGFCITTLVAWHLLKDSLKESFSYPIVYGIIWFVAMGAGALNEVVEFIAVVLFPETGVGGYYNTALDLVFNGIGGFIGIFIIHFRRKWKEKK